MTITPALVTFFILALVAVGSALGMLLSRNAIHSALFLVLNFAVGSLFFLLLNAPFIAMVQITVYAGAIMVLFLFVIMLLGAEVLRQRASVLRWQPALAVVLGVAFVAVLGYVLFFPSGAIGAAPGAVPADFGNPKAIGAELYSAYVLPFELTSFLLLVAMIGAVVLTRDRGGRIVGSPTSTEAGPEPRR